MRKITYKQTPMLHLGSPKVVIIIDLGIVMTDPMSRNGPSHGTDQEVQQDSNNTK